MDANGSRYRLFLSREDWERADVGGVPLASWWAGSPNVADDAPLMWDKRRGELTLAPRIHRFVAGRGDTPPALDDRRGAAADAFGNVYWIDASHTRVLVHSSGDPAVGTLWPRESPPAEPCDFAPIAPATPEPLRLGGLAVTSDHYLVVGVTSAPAGLIVFDLYSPDAPTRIAWPATFTPFDIAARPAGGVAVLDRDGARYWLLDRRLAICDSNESEPPAEESFQPLAGGVVRLAASPARAEGFALRSVLPGIDPIGIVALADGSVLILDRSAADGYARIVRVCGASAFGVVKSLSCLADLVDEDHRDDFQAIGHAMAFIARAAPSGQARGELYVASSEGNQAFALDLVAVGEAWSLDPDTRFYPMRRFGGTALVAARDHALYDSFDAWVPLVAQSIPRYAPSAALVTPAQDSGAPGCVWHRLMLDACVPPETLIEVESRAADEAATLASAQWEREPPLLIRKDGAELPWIRRVTRPEERKAIARNDGTLELLFQRARGRHLQLRLTWRGNERTTPRVRAMRIWYPRFSYLERYLPAVYREDAESTRFLDRFLANLEGFYTAIEDRIAAIRAILDVQAVPPDGLEWLAAWLGLALDPALSTDRRRVLIANAMRVYQYRGTAHGIRVALRLAFDERICDATFALPHPGQSALQGVRIIERYLTRTSSLPQSAVAATEGPRIGALTTYWTPAEGGARLTERYRAFLSARAAPNAASAVFTLDAPDDAVAASRWAAFCDSELGFRPGGARSENARWQAFLALRYATVGQLAGAWHRPISAFAAVTTPTDLPTSTAERADWVAFMGANGSSAVTLPMRGWQDFLARRYRRPGAMDAAYGTNWGAFRVVPLPTAVPRDDAPLKDWYRYEADVRPMQGAAHRFAVLLPTLPGGVDPTRDAARQALARRIVALEKPAHTTFEVGFYWAALAIGTARLGADTLVDEGSRSPRLAPPLVLGRGFVGEGTLAPRSGTPPRGRALALACPAAIALDS